MPETSDIGRAWDRAGAALYAAWLLCLPGGLLLALAGRPGVAAFALACFGGFVAAADRGEAARQRLDAARHRDTR